MLIYIKYYLMILNIPRFKGGSCSKVNGIYTSSTRCMKGCGKQLYAEKSAYAEKSPHGAVSFPNEKMLGENVRSVPVKPAKQSDMSRIAQVLAQTSISKRGNRKVRL